jgi:ATP synthase protein I
MVDEHRGFRRRTVQRILLAQFGLAGFLGAGFWVFSGSRAGYSALIGGLISAIASWVFARFVFAGGQRSSDQFLRRVMLGELLKLGVVVIMFGVALTALDLAFLPLISAFAVTLLTYWVALLFA